jgi:hippurate hydrolase
MHHQHRIFADLFQELVAFRRDIHAHPELGYAEHRTSAKIAEQLRAIGLDVHAGIGGTGVVGVLHAGSSDRSIGLRADMDALAIVEQTNLAYASKSHGTFHGCGHDGHIAMLLGAAQHLARTRRFDGTVNFIFQPAEEGLGGARAMVNAGLFERFPTERIFALHNWPTLPVGVLQTRPGPIMAAADKFKIRIKGKGGHAAQPERTPDAILAAANLALQLNTIIARRISPSASAVLSVTQIGGGQAHNVLPASVDLVGTVRSFDPAVQDMIEATISQMAAGVALSSGVSIDVDYDRYYPATINDAESAHFAIEAGLAAGLNATLAVDPAHTSEDFAFMLNVCKGAYIWLGQQVAEDSAPLHHPNYDFNDDVIPLGAGAHVALAEKYLTV